MRKRVTSLTMTRDADSMDAEHVARGHPRQSSSRRSQGPAVDSDQSSVILTRRHRPRESGTGRRRAARCTVSQSRRSPSLDRRFAAAARARGEDRRRSRTDARRRSGGPCSGFVERRFDVLLATDDRRERSRHLPTPTRSSSIAPTGTDSQLYQLRARRPFRSAGTRTPLILQRNRYAVARKRRGDQGIQRSRQRFSSGGARPRDPRRRQPAGRRAERHIDTVGLDVHEAARRDRPGS